MNYPEIYWMLYPQKYDLLFFILEPVLGPFIEALDVALNDGLEDFSKIIALVDLKLDKLNFVG